MLRTVGAWAALAAGVAMGQAALAEQVALAPGFEVEKALLEAARKEGKVVFWCSFREPECRDTGEKFTALTGVQLEFTRLSTGPQVQRLSQERAAGIHSVDVIHHAEPGVWETLYRAKKWLVPYIPAGAKKYGPDYRPTDGMYVVQYIVGSPIGYNKNLISEADAPKSYADLLDPKYKGKIAMPHAKHSGGFAETVGALGKIVDPAYFKKLKANDPLVVSGSQFSLNPIIANGERAIALAPVESSFVEDIAAGKPLGLVYPTEGMVVIVAFSGVVADAPHPNAARLLQEWLHSSVQQTMLTQKGNLVPHPDAQYPAGRKRLSEIKTFTLPIPEAAALSAPSKEAFADIYGG